MTDRFASPETKLSLPFRQRGSRSNNSDTPVIQRATARSEVSARLSLVSSNENINRNHLFQWGTNYQQRYLPYQNMNSRRRRWRLQNSASSSTISGSSVRAIFRTEDVLLLPTSTESNVLRGERKKFTNVSYKSWSKHKAISYLETCFSEKLSSVEL